MQSVTYLCLIKLFTANDKQLFNSNCYLRMLVHSIKLRCNCEEHGRIHICKYCMSMTHADYIYTDQLALVDEDYHVIDLQQYSESLENGQEIFTGRGKYVLLSIDSKLSTTLPCESTEKDIE